MNSSLSSIQTIIKSFLASVSGNCSCSINLNTNIGNYSILGDKYNNLMNKIVNYYPKMSTNIKGSYINGHEICNHINEVYSKES